LLLIGLPRIGGRNPRERGDEKVELFPRPLRYSSRRPEGEEKGVDVELAIDFVRLALDDDFDVAVLASADTDLVPARQFVADRLPDKTLVTVALEPLDGLMAPAPLDLPRGDVERVTIPKRDFDRMADRRNFYLSASDLSRTLDRDRWERIKQRYEPSRNGRRSFESVCKPAREKRRNGPVCRAFLVRPGRLELPPRVSRTRPSTLRVYQFRHRRVDRRV
jgi:NYN domain